jgi:hypothetical protein
LLQEQLNSSKNNTGETNIIITAFDGSGPEKFNNPQGGTFAM